MPAPKGGYQRVSVDEPGRHGQYHLWGKYHTPHDVTSDLKANIPLVYGKEITRPGTYIAYLSCANTYGYPDRVQNVSAFGTLEVRATAN
jgi:hypothetical protein